MEFGLFSESGHRGNSSATATYNADLWEIALADELGFREVWVAERGSRTSGQDPDIVSAANLLICKAAAMTKHIRLGTGIRPLPYQHPFNVATEANVCDHLTGGRYMLGYGGTHGIYGDHHKQMGIEAEKQRAMTYEAIDYIMRCFTSSEPFDFDGEFYHGRGINVLPKPVQQPHVPVAAACSGALPTLEIAAHNGFIALLGRGGNPAKEIREMGDAYVQAAEAAGRRPSRNLFRVAHNVYVAESDRQARDELRATLIPQMERQKASMHYEALGRWLREGDKLEDISYDYLVDAGKYFVGDPDSIYAQIKRFYDESGGFGVLLIFAAQGHTTPEQWERSQRLFAEHVAPRLAGLDPDRIPAGAPARVA